MGSRGSAVADPSRPGSEGPARAPLAAGWIAWFGLVALVLLAQPDAPPGAASPTHATLLRTGASGASYRAQVAALLERTRSLQADGDRLLAQHDADPGLGADPSWVSAHAGTVDALAVAYRGALDLQPGAGDAGLQACLTESLRLIWTGHALLHRAFGVDGHHAYHDSSHGNWDLDLGVNRLRLCQNLVRERS